jgi:hypothetical protein
MAELAGFAEGLNVTSKKTGSLWTAGFAARGAELPLTDLGMPVKGAGLTGNHS